MIPTGKKSAFLAIPWVLLLAASALLAGMWNDLPPDVAIHFNLAGEPDVFVGKTMGLLGFVVVAASSIMVTTILCVLVDQGHKGPKTLARTLHGTIGIILPTVLTFLIIFNVGVVLSRLWVVAVGILILIVSVALLGGHVLSCLKQHKTTSRSQFVDDSDTDTTKELLGLDEHRSSGIGMTVLALGVLSLGLGLRALLVREDIVGTLIFLAVAFILIYVGYSAIRGFRYVISAQGILVNGFMRDLLFIPAGEIRSIEVDECNPYRTFLGVGIRRSGFARGYIWRSGPTVVVHAGVESIYLGTEDPNRLMALLDEIKRH